MEQWTKVSGWNGVIAINDDHGDLICTLEKRATQSPGVSVTSHATLQERRADLIAAAPGLANALQIAIRALRDHDIDEAMAGEFEILTDALESAGIAPPTYRDFVPTSSSPAGP